MMAEEESTENVGNGRSANEIADYLQNKIPMDVWEPGEAPQSQEKALKWAGVIEEVWSENPSRKTLSVFFRLHVHAEKLEKVVEGMADFLKGPNAEYQKERQMVGISHEVKDTDLTHDFDVKELIERIEDVFQTFYDKENEDKYYAPYLCFVQSSGMGKTKIMYELCKLYKKENDICGLLVLCRPKKRGQEGVKEEEIFDHFISLGDDGHRNQDFEEIREEIFTELDKLLAPREDGKALPKQIVLFFDEAHYLLGKGYYQQGEKSMSMEAMIFRIVRLWICKKTTEHRIVAVFTGTTAKLTNFIIDGDQDLALQTDTRNARKKIDSFYELKGGKTYTPFFTTTTIGCLRFAKGKNTEDKNEYSCAVPFGRPLFASMSLDELKKAEPTIVGRIVQGEKELKNSNEACLGVLAIRAQMGQTNCNLASNLVGRSYANVVATSHDGNAKLHSIKICFPPDPVCARLAMCLMESKWSMDSTKGTIVKGEEKSFWVEKMKTVYSSKLCTPEKGDLGEVMVALYFLFCADILRYEISQDYTTFSVPLDQWIERLIDGGKKEEEKEEEGTESNKKQKVAECRITFSAIQVCRNYIRAYYDSWSWLWNKVFLENMYKSGVGFYVFAGCGVIDLVFALRVKPAGDRPEEDQYIPMFVSVKSHVYFSPSSAKKECERMKTHAENGRGELVELGALCILVVFGSSSNSKDGDYELLSSSCTKIAGGEVVSQVLRVPTDDEFKLSETFLGLTTPQDEMSEVLASHSFLGAHMETANQDNIGEDSIEDFVGKVLRSRVNQKDEVATKTKFLLTQLGNIANGSQGNAANNVDEMDTS